jgi:hypothetical protein
MTIQDTYLTGESREKVPAYADLQTEDGPVGAQFLISTEKVGRCVLLRIDQILTPLDECSLSGEHEETLCVDTPIAPASNEGQAREL